MSANDETLISLINPSKFFSKPKTAAKEKAADTAPKPTSSTIRKLLSDNKTFLMIALALGFVVYLNAWGNGLVSDDVGLQIEGSNLTKLSYIFSDPLAFVRSIITAVFYTIGGTTPWLHRSFNIFMHLGNIVLVFLVVSLIFNSRVGFFTTTIFAVHPVLVEAVTWISGGPYSQYTFFFLLSFLFYLLKEKNKKYYWVSLGIFLVALLSSNRVMTLSLILVLYELMFGNLKKNWKLLVPFLALSFIWGVVYSLQIGGRRESLFTQYYLERGVDNPLIQVPFAVVNYLTLIFWPQKLTFYHSDLTLTPFQLALYWFGLLVFLGVWVWSFFKSKQAFFWIGFFWISMLITLLPFRLGWIVAERYVYLGSIGIFILVAALLNKLVTRKKYAVLGYSIFIVIVTVLSLRTIVRNADWKDEKSLWMATVRTTPMSPKAHNNMGAIYFREKKYQEAAKEFETAIRLKANYADAYSNYGDVLQVAKKYDDAIKFYEQALKINPNLPQTYQSLASAYYSKEEYQKALEFMMVSLKLDKTNYVTYQNLALIYDKLGEKQKAQEALTVAAQLKAQRGLNE